MAGGTAIGVRSDRLELHVATALGDDAFELGGMVGEEGLSRPFRFRLDLFTRHDDIAAEDLVGHGIDFAWMGGQAPESEGMREDSAGHVWRHVHGIVSELRYCETRDRWHRYEAEVVPALWLLSRRRDCRIFQTRNGTGGSVPEIVANVLEEAGLRAADWSGLRESYRQRDYCVQYRETDLDFISRLLEDEGIWFRFRHAPGSHEIVMGDARGAYVKSGDPELHVPMQANAPQHDDLIISWERRHEIRSGQWAHKDYNFLEPGAPMEAKERAAVGLDGGENLESYDWRGGYDARSEGERRARVRIEEEESRWERVTCRSRAGGVAAGSCFEVGRHPLRRERGRRWLVTTVHHQIPTVWPGEFESIGRNSDAGGPRYRNAFECIPAELEFRPPRVTPRPSVQGIQTAVVVGPPGNEIHVDEHARVKVQFHWDRRGTMDDGSSCWIRVAQPWAGAGYGGLCIPRIGQEVVVEFEEGDPDRPLINGRLYNQAQMPPVSNAGRDPSAGPSPESIPQAAMMTSIKSSSLGGSGGSNEITLNDTGGAEGLFIKAQKDNINKVGNDQTTMIGNNREESVGVDHTELIGNDSAQNIGRNQTIAIGDSQAISVGKQKSETIGKFSMENVGIAKMINIGVAQMLTIGGVSATNVGGVMNTAVGLVSMEQVGKMKSIVVGDKFQITCGKAKLTMESSGKITLEGTEISTTGTEITVDGETIKTSGEDVTVESSGSMKLESGGKMKIEGKGNVDIDGPMIDLN